MEERDGGVKEANRRGGTEKGKNQGKGKGKRKEKWDERRLLWSEGKKGGCEGRGRKVKERCQEVRKEKGG